MKDYSKTIKKQKIKNAIKYLEDAAHIMKDLDSRVMYDDFKYFEHSIKSIISSDNGECGLKNIYKKL